MPSTVDVIETFTSLQGESTWAGLTCFFIRLAGCNLACSYCDTPRARGPGRSMAVPELVRRARASRASIVEVTGGEPLLQPGFGALALALRDRLCRPVLVETNGACDLSLVPAGVAAIMDIKTPGSGMTDAFDVRNLHRLRSYDEVKFVLCGRADYLWARRLLKARHIPSRCRAVLMSPAAGRLDPADLARWILRDRLRVRLQLQLHKLAGLA